MTTEPLRRLPYLLLLLPLILIAGIAGAGYRYHVAHRQAIESEVRQQLAAIADLKVHDVSRWRRERLGDARLIVANQLMMPALRQVLEGTASGKVRENARVWLLALCESYGYAKAVLVNSQGKVRLSAGRTGGGAEHYAELAARIRSKRDIIFDDLHYDKGLGGPHLGLSIPLQSSRGGEPEGALLLGIDPAEYLYPLLQSWPTPSRSAETLLVRREGNEVVFLNELRHRKDTALKLRFPLTDRLLPSVQGVLGSEGIQDGMDYRGAPVLAAVRRVPDSPWVLVAKVDADEVYLPIRRQALALALIAGSLILAAGAIAGMVWRHVRSRYYRQKYEAEAERRVLVERLAYLSRYANDIILLMHDSGRIVEANDRAAAAYGYAPEELLGKPLSDLLDPACLSGFEGRWKAVEAQGGAVFETRHRRKDGATFPVEISTRRIEVDGTIFRQSIIRDITERKKAEEEQSKLQQQFQHAQKMESVGRLAGGVAHDFNNLLTVINGYAALVLSRLMAGDPLRDMIAEIAKAGARAAGLTQQLLALSRRQIIQPGVLDLNGVVREVGTLLQRVVGEHIEVITELAPALGAVMADAGQMHQVLMNLAVNARDAMPDGGKLIIETANVEFDQSYAAAHAGTQAGPHVLVAVTDTGQGMDNETQSRIFDPFFTTKPTGVGTGLGLATVYGIVKQSGGWIWVYSELGKGSTFKIYLPRAAQEAETRKAASPGSVSLRGTETLLVVEDQNEVRKLAAEILTGYGYRVLEAGSGDEALSLCERFAGPVHLMITDVMMPGMTGRELAGRLAKSRPDTKVLYISGYTENLIAHQGVLERDVAFLPKPFTPEGLAAKVSEVLGQ